MWRRWGQEAADAAPYSSYTEEEFYRALALYEKTGKPTIYVFFKHIDPSLMADPGPQLTKVLAFRKKLEATRQVLYHGVADEAAFVTEIEKHLIAFHETPPKPLRPGEHVPILPDSVQAAIDKQNAEADKHKADNQKLLGIDRLDAGIHFLFARSHVVATGIQGVFAGVETPNAGISNSNAGNRSGVFGGRPGRCR
jgi:hypothetical protein